MIRAATLLDVSVMEEGLDETTTLAAVSCSFAEWSAWVLELGVEDGEDYGDSGRFHFVAFMSTGIKKPRVMNPGAQPIRFFSGDCKSFCYGGTEVERNFKKLSRSSVFGLERREASNVPFVETSIEGTSMRVRRDVRDIEVVPLEKVVFTHPERRQAARKARRRVEATETGCFLVCGHFETWAMSMATCFSILATRRALSETTTSTAVCTLRPSATQFRISDMARSRRARANRLRKSRRIRLRR